MTKRSIWRLSSVRKSCRYAVVQLIEVSQNGRKKTGRRSDTKEDVYLYVKEGRVGDRRGVRQRLDKQESPQAAVRQFNKVFEQLTGNKFVEWERQKTFSKQRNKYFPIDMVSGDLLQYSTHSPRETESLI